METFYAGVFVGVVATISVVVAWKLGFIVLTIAIFSFMAGLAARHVFA